MSDEVLTEERDGVLIVSLNRPQARNAVNEALATAVGEAMEPDPVRASSTTPRGGWRSASRSAWARGSGRSGSPATFSSQS